MTPGWSGPWNFAIIIVLCLVTTASHQKGKQTLLSLFTAYNVSFIIYILFIIAIKTLPRLEARAQYGIGLCMDNKPILHTAAYSSAVQQG